MTAKIAQCPICKKLNHNGQTCPQRVEFTLDLTQPCVENFKRSSAFVKAMWVRNENTIQISIIDYDKTITIQGAISGVTIETVNA